MSGRSETLPYKMQITIVGDDAHIVPKGFAQIPIIHRRDGSHTAVFGPSTALTVHRTVIHYRLARLRYVPDRPYV